MKETTFIYSLNCPITDEPRYIGKSNNPKERFRHHCTFFEKTHKSNWIKSLKNKNQFPKLEIIDEILIKDWQFWECHYISLYKSWGFNLVNGDAGGLGTTRFTEEVKQKMSKAKIGKVSNTKGIKFSEERKQKISYSNPKIKLVECLDTLTNNKFTILGTVNMAKHLKINRSSISENLRGKTKLVYKRYKFSYPCQ